MKTKIDSINSDIIVQGANAQTVNHNEIGKVGGNAQKSRPHIIAARAARQARRANH